MMIRNLLFPLPFALVWMVLVKEFDIVSFMIGYSLAFGISLLITDDERQESIRLKHIPRRVFALIVYLLILTRDIFMAGVDVSLRVMGFRPITQSGIIAVETMDDSELIAGLSGHSITITPGELVIEFDQEQKVMYVHCLDVKRSEPVAQAGQEARLKLFKRILDRD